MEYYNTGIFSKEQRAICRKIRNLINEAKKKDLIIRLNKDKICAYLLKEVEIAADDNATDLQDFNHPLKSLNCGIINQNIGRNEYYFENDFIKNKED